MICILNKIRRFFLNISLQQRILNTVICFIYSIANQRVLTSKFRLRFHDLNLKKKIIYPCFAFLSLYRDFHRLLIVTFIEGSVPRILFVYLNMPFNKSFLLITCFSNRNLSNKHTACLSR